MNKINHGYGGQPVLANQIETKDAEIERLKEEDWHWSEVAVKLKWATETNTELLAEIERLKALIAHAADALEEEFGEASPGNKALQPWRLIQELQKAAK
jgi:hypothetical protein